MDEQSKKVRERILDYKYTSNTFARDLSHTELTSEVGEYLLHSTHCLKI
jgi:hypothetical protein